MYRSHVKVYRYQHIALALAVRVKLKLPHLNPMSVSGRECDEESGVVERLLHELYYDPKSPSAYTSIGNVYRAARNINPSIKRRDVDQWFRSQLTPTLHKPTRSNFPRNQVIVMSIDEQWQADLCDMSLKSEMNDDYTFILTCIDCFSKYAWAIPLKSKHADEIIRALTDILEKSGRKPKRLQTDKGKEFLNRKVKSFLQKHNIQLFTSESEKKASIVERFNRTMKGRMYKYFTARNTYRYVNVLQTLVDGYNQSFHRSIKMRPANVRKKHQVQIRQHLYGGRKNQRKSNVKSKKLKYTIGDLVRISKNRLTFGRGYHPNWSEEIFIVLERKNFVQPLYYLRDFNGESIKGGFYENEIQLVTEPEEYRIEKVLRTKRVNGRILYLVKWKGFSDKFNSWVENPRQL